MAAYRTSFGSDNHAGVHDSVLRMIGAANKGRFPAYGHDPWTAQATGELRDLFGARGGVYFVFNGTAERVPGSQLLQVRAPDGKLKPDLVASRLAGRGDEHSAQPRAVAITQVTELGTCYTMRELRDLAEFCRASDLRLYLDGARLANAVAQLGCQPGDLAAQ